MCPAEKRETKTKLDKVFGRPYSRGKYHILNSGYSHHGANMVKKSLIGWDSTSLGPKSDIDDNINRLRQRSRDLYMGGALVATGAIKTIRTNVIGAGLKVKPAIHANVLGLSDEEAEEWQRRAQQEFNLWAGSKNSDAARRNNFAELQQLAFISWLVSGDVFVVPKFKKRIDTPYETCVLLVDADRVCNPQMSDVGDRTIIEGLEFSDDGEVVAFHICNQHPYDSVNSKIPRKWTRVEAYGKKTGRPNVLHIMEMERTGQARGVPMLAPIIEAAKQLGRYTEAELVAAVVAGMFTVFLSTETPNEPLGQSAVPDEELIDEDDENTVELGNGAVVDLGPNGKAQTVNPGRPYAGFNDFVVAVCRQIGAALELPYEVLTKQFTSSYSASRGALIEAWKMYKMRRSWFISDFCQPIYEEVISEAIALGRIEAPGFWSDPLIRSAWLNAEWYGPTQGQLDPLKEVNAAAKRVEEGFSTGARETSELTGGEFEANVEQIKRENRLKEIAGMKKNGGGDSAVLGDEQDPDKE